MYRDWFCGHDVYESRGIKTYMQYFTHENISEHMIRIRDITGVFIYLIIGDKRACLLDTGNGFGDLRAYVDALTDKDYDVILTHGHVDHASGASLFKDKHIYMNLADWELLQVHTTFAQRKDFAKIEPIILDIPMSDYNPVLDVQPLPLQDGQLFDLGGITLQAIHTPGHTQGMTMVLMKEERTILFGDGCGVSVLLLDEYASTVSEYLQTLRHLKTYEHQYNHIIRNHGTGVSPKELLDNVIECCECILHGTDDKAIPQHLPMDCPSARMAKALRSDGHGRVDGKEGNIAYSPEKVR